MLFGYWDSRLRERGTLAGMRDGLLFAARYAPDDDPPPPNNPPPPNDPPKPEWAGEFGDKFDADRAWNTIKTLREAEKTLKRERDGHKRKVDELEGKDATEAEKLEARLKALETENTALKTAQQTAVIRDAFAEAARQENAVYPEDIYRLLDSEAIEVEDGKVKNAAKLVQALKASRPALFGNGSADGNKGRQQQGADSGDMNSMLRRAAGRG